MQGMGGGGGGRGKEEEERDKTFFVFKRSYTRSLQATWQHWRTGRKVKRAHAHTALGHGLHQSPAAVAPPHPLRGWVWFTWKGVGGGWWCEKIRINEQQSSCRTSCTTSSHTTRTCDNARRRAGDNGEDEDASTHTPPPCGAQWWASFFLMASTSWFVLPKKVLRLSHCRSAKRLFPSVGNGRDGSWVWLR